MKHFFTLLFLVAIVFVKTVNAQAPNWLWAELQQGNPDCYTGGTEILASPSGKIYMDGRFTGTMTLGGVIASTGSEATVSGEMDSAGNFTWVTPHAASGGNDYNYGFARDKDDNTYTTGIYGSSSFLDKYDKDGVKKWGVNQNGSSAGYAIITDADNNVYLTGDFAGTMTFGSTTLTSVSNSNDIFLVKYDSSGNFKWAVSAGGSGYDGGRSAGIDGDGNVYVCGSYNGTATFGTITPPTATGVFPNMYLAKYDPSGNIIHVSVGTNAGFDTNYQFWHWEKVIVDQCGNAYVTGFFTSTAQFDGLSVTGAGGYDVFVSKCHSDGKWEWVKSAGGTGTDLAIGIALDKAQDVYLSGAFSNTAQFGPYSLTASAVNGSPFVAKYSNSTGDIQWVQAGTGSGSYGFQGITVDKKGYVYLCGNGSGTGTFGPSTVIDNSSCYSHQNIIIAKLDTAATLKIMPDISSAYCLGSTVDLSYTVVGSFNGGNTFTAQLSDSSGNFISSTDIGSSASLGSGTIKITIPPNTKPGSTYLIRVVSSSPATSSYAACNYITIGGGNLTAHVSNDTSICSGSFVQLHASGGATYSWSPGATLNDSTSASPYAAPTSPQVYTVIVTAGSCGSDTEKVRVDVSPAANITVSPVNAKTCAGTGVQLTASGASSYTWLPNTGLSCTTCSSPVAHVQATTIYTVTGNGGACSNTFFDTVTVGNTSVGGLITAVRDTICQGTPGNLTLDGSSGFNLQWQSSTDGANFSNVGDTTIQYKTSPLQQTTWYRVTVGSGNCSSISDTQKLYVPPALTAYFNSKQPSARVIAFSSDSSGGSIRSYHWDFGDNSTSTENNPVHTFTRDSTYYVCLTLYDGSNCSYTFCRYTEVTDGDGVPTISAAGNWVIYPNPFSEQLSLSGEQFNGAAQSIEIYDVLGQMVMSRTTGNSINTSVQLNVSSLASGMYYLTIKTANANYVQKVVKQ